MGNFDKLDKTREQKSESLKNWYGSSLIPTVQHTKSPGVEGERG